MELVLVRKEDKQILRNLMEKYEYEFSQYTNVGLNQEGLFDDPYFGLYWSEEGRYPYFIKVDGELAGFVMISGYQEAKDIASDHTLSEFFVIYKYRRLGIGKEAVFKVLAMHHGKWQLKYHPKNTPSVYFWNQVIREYTNNNYQLIDNYPLNEVDYEDGTKASVISFDN